jgi:NAD(P) transhydrogenase subunit alpha
MQIAVPRERTPGERRVALTPDGAARLAGAGLQVSVEAGAGVEAGFPDAAYESAGIRMVPVRADLYGAADLVLKVENPLEEEVALVPEGAAVVSFLRQHRRLELVASYVSRRITFFSMDAVPRITRAQGMDALSSMSTISGYKATLVAAAALGRIFPMLVTAAGTLPPARVLVIGAGVAGLQAIATARRLGAVVHGFDIRPATKEQVESLGASFIEIDMKGEATEDAGGYAREISAASQERSLETLARHIRDMDVVITTALIPGKPAPLLITEAMVRSMKPGAVIVDVAAEAGGNCALTQPGADVSRHGVTILGPLNLPATVPLHASQMYSRNITAFVLHVVKDGALAVDLDDPIMRAMCVTRNGEVVHGPTRELMGGEVAGKVARAEEAGTAPRSSPA